MKLQQGIIIILFSLLTTAAVVRSSDDPNRSAPMMVTVVSNYSPAIMKQSSTYDNTSTNNNANASKSKLLFGDDNYYGDLINPSALSSLNTTSYHNATHRLPKEQEQPKQWPEVVIGLFVTLGVGLLAMRAVKAVRNRKRHDYEDVPGMTMLV